MRTQRNRADLPLMVRVTFFATVFLFPTLSWSADAQTYFDKAQEAQRKGLVGSAERYYLRALHHSADHAPACEMLADLYFVQGRYAKSLEIIEDGLAENPDEAQLWARKGLIKRAMGDPTAARTAYEQALSLAADDPVILQRAAGFYQTTGNRAKAEELSQRRRQLQPQGATRNK